MSKIYIYKNLSEFSIDNIKDIEVKDAIGTTISEIHKSVDPKGSLFCVFTPLEDVDIVVKSEKSADVVRSCIKGKPLIISIQKTSIWYHPSSIESIIISNSIKMNDNEIKNLLSEIVEIIDREKEDKKKSITTKEMYIVYNKRNGKEIIRTPNLQKAIEMCNKNISLLVRTRSGKIVYKSKYGRVSVNNQSSIDASNKLKAQNGNSNGIFVNIKNLF